MIGSGSTELTEKERVRAGISDSWLLTQVLGVRNGMIDRSKIYQHHYVPLINAFPQSD